MRFNVGTKLLLSFLSILILVIIVGFYTLSVNQNALEKSVGQGSIFLVEDTIKGIDKTIFLKIEEIERFSNDILLQEELKKSNQEFEALGDIDSYLQEKDREWVNAPKGAIADFMEQKINNPLSDRLRESFVVFFEKKYGYKNYLEVFVTNKYGANVAQTGKTSDYYQADEMWWQIAKKNNFSVNKFEYDESAGSWGVPLGVVVKDSKGNFIGIIKAVFNSGIIAKESEIDNKKYVTTELMLLTSEGETVYKTGVFKFLENRSNEPFFKKITEDSGFFVATEDTREKLFSYTHSQGFRNYEGLDWILVLSHDTREVFASLRNLRNLLLGVTGILLLVIGLLAFFMSRLISVPVKKLTETAQEIAGGNLNKKVEVKSKDEIGELGGAFNIMTSKLKESYEGLEEKVRVRTAELELAKNKSETLLASIGEGVFGIDKERNIVYFNTQAEAMSGYNASEVIGKPYYDFLKFVKVKDRSENIEFIRTALKGKTADMGNHTVLIRKDKRELPVADSASPIKDKGGNILGVIVVFRDATKERELEIARAELVSFASHQLKSPLTSMSWNIETLKKSKSEDESKKIVDEIDKSIDSMKDLVAQVLNISRIEQGMVELKPKPTQLIDIVDDILKESASTAKQRNVTVEFTKPERPLPELNVDPQYTHEIFKNIISNAIKYTKNKVTMSFERKDGNILFVCSDNGVGIPKDEQSKIFSKFYVASNVAKTGTKGVGLGLSIAKALVERMNGRIWFESEENKETTFYISLPLLQ